MEKTVSDIKRIAILGAESTGKTTLSRSLAMRYQSVWVPEYAREYMATHSQEYSAEEIVKMAKLQFAQEQEQLRKANRFLFVDTELIIAKVWCEDVFGACPRWISEQLQPTHYDLYLLTANDLPWVADPVRMNSQRRDYFFNWYKRELDQLGFDYAVINGRYEQRLLNAVKAIEKHFGES
ncbi:MAG: putative ATPase/kinase involved in NAD metabolism [Bacteroidetes bacterium]|nr:MAG: putative ATPase/kinase involved in NAD metabolism [Bacteroidota bacterium]